MSEERGKAGFFHCLILFGSLISHKRIPMDETANGFRFGKVENGIE